MAGYITNKINRLGRTNWMIPLFPSYYPCSKYILLSTSTNDLLSSSAFPLFNLFMSPPLCWVFPYFLSPPLHPSCPVLLLMCSCKQKWNDLMDNLAILVPIWYQGKPTAADIKVYLLLLPGSFCWNPSVCTHVWVWACYLVCTLMCVCVTLIGSKQRK